MTAMNGFVTNHLNHKVEIYKALQLVKGHTAPIFPPEALYMEGVVK